MMVHFSFLHGVEVNEKIRLYVEKKVQIAGKALGDLARAEVEIHQNKKGLYEVQVSILTNEASFRAEETAKNIEEAIDIIEKELQEQIRDNKEKIATERRRGNRSIKKKMVITEDARF